MVHPSGGGMPLIGNAVADEARLGGTAGVPAASAGAVACADPVGVETPQFPEEEVEAVSPVQQDGNTEPESVPELVLAAGGEAALAAPELPEFPETGVRAEALTLAWARPKIG